MINHSRNTNIPQLIVQTTLNQMVQFNYKSDFKKIKILARAYKFLSTSRTRTPQESFSSQGIIFAFVLNADAWLLEIRT
jgi:hypothetical protein